MTVACTGPDRLRARIPVAEFEDVMGQHYCELDLEFLGFLDVYKPLSHLIPTNRVVIDLGCYLAAQAYLFTEHAGYIGVNVPMPREREYDGDTDDMHRFTPDNATHHACSIQTFVADVWPTLGLELGEVFAICSHVPDHAAVDLAKATFSDIAVYYPSSSDCDALVRQAAARAP